MALVLKKIESWLLIIFLFSLPWQTRWIIQDGLIKDSYWEYGTISLYASDILLIIIIILNLIRHYVNKTKINLSKTDLLLLLTTVLVLGANIYLSLNKLLSLFHAGWLLLALGLFIIMRQEIITRSTALVSLIAGAALASALGVWQFISQSTMASKWLGLAQHISENLGSSVIEAVAPDGVTERWLRAYGSLDHPNMLGGLTALIIFFCFYLIFKLETKSNKEKLIVASFILLVAGLICSFSRSAWLAAVSGIIIYLIFVFKHDFKLRLKPVLPLFIIGLITTALLAIPYYYIFLPRFSTASRLEKISAIERVAGYQEALPIIKNNLVLGTGLGTYGLALQANNPKQLVWYYQPIHNFWLLLLAETGLVGLALWLWFIFKQTINAWKNNKEDHLIITGTIVVLLILGLFDHWLMSLHFGILLSAAALGLALKKTNTFDSNGQAR